MVQLVDRTCSGPVPDLTPKWLLLTLSVYLFETLSGPLLERSKEMMVMV